MEKLKLNETPVRTSKSFNINNIKLENINIPEKVNEFNNLEVTNNSSKINIKNEKSDCNLTYGIGDILINQVKNNQNKSIIIIADSSENKEETMELSFKFNEENQNLIENIHIIAKENSNTNITIKYETDGELNYFHNGIIKVYAKENSNVTINIVNLMNINSDNFLSIENNIEKQANIYYKVVDFGGKNSITNYYSNIEGESSNNEIETIYLGRENQTYDLNYIAELRGEKSNINIEVEGALKESSKKHFKGTIDFKKGSKKATGNENESCMLLSDKAKSIALPMLLCSEEDVEGNHSSSAGKIGEKELFYIMSRGFEQKEAMKLMVRAKFNKFLEGIKSEELKNQISYEIDKRLD